MTPDSAVSRSPDPSASPSPDVCIIAPEFEMPAVAGRNLVVLPADETQINLERIDGSGVQPFDVNYCQLFLSAAKVREFIALLVLAMDWLDEGLPEEGPEYDAWKAKRDADLASALRTIDAYPEDQPPTSSSDRFWFDKAARQIATAVRAHRRVTPPSECTWTGDRDPDFCDGWDTGCGEKFVFIEGGPTENDMRFCPYCGGGLVVATPASPSGANEDED
jgi:hypothetical protein